LHRTAYGGHIATAEALLAGGANIEAPSLRNSSTPLHLAAKAGRADMCALLVRHGAAMTLRNRRGDVPIAMTSDQQTLRTLLDPALFRAGVYATDPCVALALDAGSSGAGSSGSASEAAAAMDDLSLGDSSEDRPPAGTYGTGEGPFKSLGAEAAALFERALEQARKNMDINLGIFPFDLLSHDERIVTLARVATAVHGYAACPRDNVTESALYAIYASARERVQAEVESADSKPIDTGSWRRLVLDAYEAEVGTAALRGLDVAGALRVKKECWSVMADQVAASASFGHELFWTLWQIFRERDPFTQRLLYSRLGAAESYFGPRPSAVTDTDVSDAERKIAALTPKGQAAMSGVFPPDHFASAMTMRQLVFSVEGGAGPPGCLCEYCQRCRQVLTGTKPTLKGRKGAKRGGARGGSVGVDGLLGGCEASGAKDTDKKSSGAGRAGGKGKGGNKEGKDKEREKDEASVALSPDAMWTLTDSAWNAIAAQQDDVLNWFQCLPPAQRRAALTLPERELDRSMATSADWDVLTTAEMDYDYGTSGAGPEGALIEYDEASGCFTPGQALLKPEQAVPAMVHSLDPQKVRQSQLWRDPAMLEYLDAATRRALGARVLELHFTRLFAVKLLAKFGEAAREAAAQAALESLLADEEAAKEGAKSKKSKKKKKKAKQAAEQAAAEEEKAAQEAAPAEDAAQEDATNEVPDPPPMAKGTSKPAKEELEEAEKSSDSASVPSGAFAALSEDAPKAVVKGVPETGGLATGSTVDAAEAEQFQPKLTKKQRERERKEQAKREKDRAVKEAAAAAASAADARRIREEEEALARAIAESMQTVKDERSRKKGVGPQQQRKQQRQPAPAAPSASRRPAPQPQFAPPPQVAARRANVRGSPQPASMPVQARGSPPMPQQRRSQMPPQQQQQQMPPRAMQAGYGGQIMQQQQAAMAARGNPPPSGYPQQARPLSQQQHAQQAGSMPPGFGAPAASAAYPAAASRPAAGMQPQGAYGGLMGSSGGGSGWGAVQATRAPAAGGGLGGSSGLGAGLGSGLGTGLGTGFSANPASTSMPPARASASGAARPAQPSPPSGWGGGGGSLPGLDLGSGLGAFGANGAGGLNGGGSGSGGAMPNGGGGSMFDSLMGGSAAGKPADPFSGGPAQMRGIGGGAPGGLGGVRSGLGASALGSAPGLSGSAGLGGAGGGLGGVGGLGAGIGASSSSAFGGLNMGPSHSAGASAASTGPGGLLGANGGSGLLGTGAGHTAGSMFSQPTGGMAGAQWNRSQQGAGANSRGGGGFDEPLLPADLIG